MRIIIYNPTTDYLISASELAQPCLKKKCRHILSCKSGINKRVICSYPVSPSPWKKMTCNATRGKVDFHWNRTIARP